MANAQPRRQRQSRSVKTARIIPLSSRPRLKVGDIAEICGSALPQNIGRRVIVRDFYDDGWVGVESISGLLVSRDRETGEIERERHAAVVIRPENLYRIDRYAAFIGVCHV